MKSQRELDSLNLSKTEYLKKYYSNDDIKGWSYWKHKILDYIFDVEKRSNFISNMQYRNIEFDFNRIDRFYSNLKDSTFDDELKKFFTYMQLEGFYEYYDISFEQWINTKNFTNPNKKFELPLSIIEANKLEHGGNYIKSQLMNLEFWKIIY